MSACIVVSEEEVEFSEIRSLVEEELLGTWSVVLAKKSEEVMSFLKEVETEIVFVRIDDISNKGFQITREIKRTYPKIRVVWMAYSKSYALDAFNENVDDFVLLPIIKDRLKKTIGRLKKG